MALVGDGVLAVSQGVPELDGAVTGSGNDLAVVGGEGNGEDIVGVADECPGGLTGGELPQAERLVPRGGQSVGTVGGDNLYPNARISQPHPNFALFDFRQPPALWHSSGFGYFLGWISETYTVGDDVGVALKRALGVTVCLLVAGKVPDDQSLIATAREQHVGAIKKDFSQNHCPYSTNEKMHSKDIREYTRGRM